MSPRLPDGSRSIDSPFVWRLFLFMSFVALGLCITFILGHRMFYAVSWALITAGWFATSMWLWRKHVQADDAAWEAARRNGRTR